LRHVWRPDAVIFVGIPATGKSTFYREHFFTTHVRINLDMLRTRHREDILLRACIEARQPFVVDNTNLTGEERKRTIVLAGAAGFRITGYYFQSSIGDAITRNAARTGKAQIPAKAIGGAHKRLQLPTYGEGFETHPAGELGEGYASQFFENCVRSS
jgi:predicted kinase